MKVMKKMQKFLLIFALLLTSVITPLASAAEGVIVYVSDEGDDSTGTGGIDAPYATLQKAVDVAVGQAIAQSADTATVMLLSDLPLTSNQVLDAGAVEVTIASDAEGPHSIYRDENYNGRMIEVDGGNITFNNLIVDGSNVEISGVAPVAVQIESGTTTFRHTELKNHHITGNTSSAVIFTTSSSGKTIIEEGTYIHSNTVGGSGSVLGAGTTGQLFMKGGHVTENTVVEGSAAVIVLIGQNNWPIFAMTGGRIENNAVATVAISKLPGNSVRFIVKSNATGKYQYVVIRRP